MGRAQADVSGFVQEGMVVPDRAPAQETSPELHSPQRNPPPDERQGQQAGRGQWLVLAVVLVGSFMAVLDKSGTGFNERALPGIPAR